ncbi:hypothetical protein D9M73_292120 [compost metagenome]
MNTMALTFRAIWWPATIFSPSSPISRAITEKMLDSAKMAMPIGRPTPTRRLITAVSGRSQRANRRLGRYTGARFTQNSMPSSIDHITVPVAQPQPGPPRAGKPKWP